MKYFYKDITLEVPENVYYPLEDSELLSDIIEKINVKNKKVLDMGCGSGFLAILLAKKGAIVSAVDINQDAVNVTKKNAKMNDVKIDVMQSDLFEKIKENFDLIIFNPPYLPIEEDDITYSGGKSGRKTIKKFIINAKKFLNKNGKIILLISSLTNENEVIKLFEKNKMKVKILKRKKIPWEELIVIEACL
ncbi:MAG: methyltransferase [Candidatus Aenigmatarchaeota archaeon]